MKIFREKCRMLLILFSITLTQYCALCSGLAATRYVATGGGNISPYDTWEKAATSIVSAGLWTAVQNGDTIMVSNGTYSIPAVYYLNSKGVEIIGVSGAEHTSFYGAGGNVGFNTWTTNTVVFSGITFSNFSWAINVGGGPLWKFKDCVFKDNARAIYVAANTSIYASNCVFRGHTESAIHYIGSSAELVDCLITENSGGNGGGVYANAAGMKLYNCHLINNTGTSGGGVYLNTVGSLVENCVITGNQTTGAGGGAYIRSGSIIRNSLLAHNTSANNGGGAALDAGIMVNCTVVSNVVTGTLFAGGVNTANASVILNSIVYFNTAPQAGGNHRAEHQSGIWTNSCTIPDPGTWGKGVDCITLNPMLDNFRPVKGSPVINAGLYEAWMDDAVDLDGFPRLDWVSGIPDMGAFEYRPPPSGTIIMSW